MESDGSDLSGKTSNVQRIQSHEITQASRRLTTKISSARVRGPKCLGLLQTIKCLVAIAHLPPQSQSAGFTHQRFVKALLRAGALVGFAGKGIVRFDEQTTLLALGFSRPNRLPRAHQRTEHQRQS